MPKLDLMGIEQNNRTGYPQPFDQPVAGRWVRRLTPVMGLQDFGASHVVLKPGAWSSQRHWHEDEDEMVIMLSGQAVLIDDTGRTPMMPGDVAIFPKNDGNGHHLVNESASDCVFIAVVRAAEGLCHYPDIDMKYSGANGYTRKDGLSV